MQQSGIWKRSRCQIFRAPMQKLILTGSRLSWVSATQRILNGRVRVYISPLENGRPASCVDAPKGGDGETPPITPIAFYVPALRLLIKRAARTRAAKPRRA